MTEPGTRTEDIARIAARRSVNTDRQRRAGWSLVIAGTTICIGAFGAAQVAAVITRNDLFGNDVGHLYAVLALIALIALGTSLISAGVAKLVTARVTSGIATLHIHHERTHRRLGQMAAEIHDLAGQHRSSVDALSARLQDKAQTLGPVIEGLPERLERIEKALADVPHYGQGVIDGAQMRANALGEEHP